MDIKEMQDMLLDSIDILIEKRFKDLAKFNYYIEAKIVKKNENNTYDIEIKESILLNINSREGTSFDVGDVVLVCVPNADYSNMFIDLKRT